MTNPSATSAYVIAYETIRDKILNGELEGGTKLVEERLAEELGVSRTPVREAIRRLEQEGLIKKKRVVKPTESDLRHLFQVRMILEGHAVRTAAAYMTEEELEQLAQCVEIGRTGSVEEIMKANKKFHDLIVQASKNPVMINIIDQMQSIIYLFRKTVVYHKRPYLIDEHQDIYEAIKQRDGDKAERLMKAHLQADLDFSLHVL
ncbi:GntR family transcriptional regulator [Jeotgalibacillus sp. S-D1]|uniref:GntR family transcriptional regulator n=1 Tax=Jeotgalibacillus sp. S-D1 TaxID=2552189 RepID=UPI0010596428|nr:GntR family transcriptional regulator [Jeotgalibacillus sp. S-D1]TDL32930.1 GntR family transcriptional regulator [Jeotgalibacillus sp. S-D1]